MINNWLYIVADPHAVHHASSASSNDHWVLALLLLGVGFIAGVGFGRKRGLKHLGQVEFNTRWRNVRSHRRF